MRHIILIASVLGLGCTQYPDAVDPIDGGSDTLGADVLKSDTLKPDKIGTDAGPPEAPVEAPPEAPSEAPIAEALDEAPSACAGKADDETCGAESCGGTTATHRRCKAGVCVTVVEDCYLIACITADMSLIGECSCVGARCSCAEPKMRMAVDCPAGQVCFDTVPTVPGGAHGSCVTPDGGAG